MIYIQTSLCSPFDNYSKLLEPNIKSSLKVMRFNYKRSQHEFPQANQTIVKHISWLHLLIYSGKWVLENNSSAKMTRRQKIKNIKFIQVVTVPSYIYDGTVVQCQKKLQFYKFSITAVEFF